MAMSIGIAAVVSLAWSEGRSLTGGDSVRAGITARDATADSAVMPRPVQIEARSGDHRPLRISAPTVIGLLLATSISALQRWSRSRPFGGDGHPPTVLRAVYHHRGPPLLQLI